MPVSRVGEGKRRELVVLCSSCDASQLDLVGDLNRVSGKRRAPVVFEGCVNPVACGCAVALGHGDEGEQPPGVPPHGGRASLPDHVRHVVDATDLPCVASVDGDLAEHDDARNVEYAAGAGSVFAAEPPLERSRRLGKPSGLEEHARVPRLKVPVGPLLPVPLGRDQTVGCNRESLVVAVEIAEHFAVPHVREPETRIVLDTCVLRAER